MKKYFLFLLLAFANLYSKAQEQNPVTWAASYHSLSANEGEIVIRARIQPGWHTYSQKVTADGPIATSFSFQPSAAYELLGKTTESEAHEEYVPAFEAKIFVYHEAAEFKQKIKLKKPGSIVNLSVEYMCCNDMMCLPPKTLALNVKTQ